MEFFVEDMKSLPTAVENSLCELRQLDNKSRNEIKSLGEEEGKLFEELALLSKGDPDFDEGPITEKFQKLLTRRHGSLTVLDEQMKKIQKLYDVVDGRITFLGNQ